MTSESTEFTGSDSATARLCLSCGMCCGTPFFGYVELKPGDDATLLGTLLPLERREDRLIFRLPCTKLQGGCCTIYAQRPQVCRGYRCRILREVEAAPDRLPSALEKVAQLLAQFAELKRHLHKAGFLALDHEVPAAIKAFRTAYIAALEANDTGFFIQHQETILRWKKAAWLMTAFDEKAAARLHLPSRTADAPRSPT